VFQQQNAAVAVRPSSSSVALYSPVRDVTASLSSLVASVSDRSSNLLSVDRDVDSLSQALLSSAYLYLKRTRLPRVGIAEGWEG